MSQATMLTFAQTGYGLSLVDDIPSKTKMASCVESVRFVGTKEKLEAGKNE